MAESSIWFLEAEAAAETFNYYRTVDGINAILIGPTKLLTQANTQISGIDGAKKYYIVIGTNADAVADPAIKPPPP